MSSARNCPLSWTKNILTKTNWITNIAVATSITGLNVQEHWDEIMPSVFMEMSTDSFKKRNLFYYLKKNEIWFLRKKTYLQLTWNRLDTQEEMWCPNSSREWWLSMQVEFLPYFGLSLSAKNLQCSWKKPMIYFIDMLG